ncbi:hypothetical protein AA313_de0204185 [Arthrobotrys entomopaga]|nr:hypothetical protein AA313_de0204185 [Arthrobotrys entomopaga]
MSGVMESLPFPSVTQSQGYEATMATEDRKLAVGGFGQSLTMDSAYKVLKVYRLALGIIYVLVKDEDPSWISYRSQMCVLGEQRDICPC